MVKKRGKNFKEKLKIYEMRLDGGSLSLVKGWGALNDTFSRLTRKIISSNITYIILHIISFTVSFTVSFTLFAQLET